MKNKTLRITMDASMRRHSILFLQTRPGGCWSLSESLEEKGYWVDSIHHLLDATTFLDRRFYDIFIMDIFDLCMGECLDLLGMLKPLETEIIVIADRFSYKWQKQVLKMGVFEYISGLIDPVILENVVDRCLKERSYPLAHPNNSVFLKSVNFDVLEIPWRALLTR